ncbi:hypothetical protein AL035_04380 [Salipiger aestuarii]|uniref:Uncharacterized protein n=1 Tax=Salipiger aestuarii TaxID=568098 RepID=A0A327YIB6_9RHOB|nr:hypothetical protein [Salipiger aestuarii]EIE50497.1 hypothetical protein C357_14027 [Citreicella sp. 357]KAB2542855.1 hypothetical protein AL035_04380 [Salipiger aestuarii]RAK20770.1 hypothetical protein ATI53_100518 [Salipiger aestuarii]
MEALVWLGALISVLGLLGLIWSIVQVWKARRGGMDDEALRAVVRRMVPINMGALMGSVLGLMMVIIGIFLG